MFCLFKYNAPFATITVYRCLVLCPGSRIINKNAIGSDTVKRYVMTASCRIIISSGNTDNHRRSLLYLLLNIFQIIFLIVTTILMWSCHFLYRTQFIIFSKFIDRLMWIYGIIGCILICHIGKNIWCDRIVFKKRHDHRHRCNATTIRLDRTTIKRCCCIICLRIIGHNPSILWILLRNTYNGRYNRQNNGRNQSHKKKRNSQLRHHNRTQPDYEQWLFFCIG